MDTKKFFAISFFLIFLFSSVFSATVSDGSPTVINDVSTGQSFAQVNARITELANKIEIARKQDLNFQDYAILKSDLQGFYGEMVRINQASEQQILLGNIIIVIMAFSIMFLLVGKNLIPQNKKESKKEDEKESIYEKDLIITNEQNNGGI